MYITIENPSSEGASVAVVGSQEMSGLTPTTPPLTEVLSTWPMSRNRRRQPLHHVPMVVAPQSFDNQPSEIEGALLVTLPTSASEQPPQPRVRVALRRSLGNGERWLANLVPGQNIVTHGVAVFPLSKIRVVPTSQRPTGA